MALFPTETEREADKAENGHTVSETLTVSLRDLINYSVSCGHAAQLGFTRFSVSRCLFSTLSVFHTPDNIPLVRVVSSLQPVVQLRSNVMLCRVTSCRGFFSRQFFWRSVGFVLVVALSRRSD